MTSPIVLEYDVEDGGWATATLRHQGGAVAMTVSYLHDSLGELTRAAISLAGGASKAEVVFMDEPGEHHLVLSRRESLLELVVEWYDGWVSWNVDPPEEPKPVLSVVVGVDEFCAAVRDAVGSVLATHGVDGYLDRWGEHEFPSSDFEHLSELVGAGERGAAADKARLHPD